MDKVLNITRQLVICGNRWRQMLKIFETLWQGMEDH